MEKVNYIVHLNATFEMFNRDERIKQGHITLYIAFFQKWNRDFFKKKITVNRTSIMERAKFKSKTTYHNYLRDLNDWGYLNYFPSFHPARSSKISMPIFGTTSEQALNKYRTSSATSTVQKMANFVPEPGQNMIPFIKHKTKENFNKLSKPIFNESEAVSFFNKNNWPEIEARKFYAFIRSKKWKTENWQILAKIFAKNNFKLKEPKKTSPISGYVNYLRQRVNKNKV